VFLSLIGPSASSSVSIPYLTLVHYFVFLFFVRPIPFMSMMSLKLQAPKNFKYIYLFGDKILKWYGAFGKHFANYDNALRFIPFVVESIVEPNYELLDSIITQKNIALTKKQKTPMN
jgi:hypothetical protein